MVASLRPKITSHEFVVNLFENIAVTKISNTNELLWILHLPKSGPYQCLYKYKMQSRTELKLYTVFEEKGKYLCNGAKCTQRIKS